MSDSTVHRLLDEAFAGVEMTSETQDLKEEIRANLMDRVSELTASGVAPGDAARRAVDELGDVHELVEDGVLPAAPGPTAADAGSGKAASSGAAAAHQHRVPASPRYVAGVVVAVVVLLLAVAPVGAVAAGWLDAASAMAPVIVALYLSGPVVGWIVATSLMRETATNYGMPRRRAIAYGSAATLLMIGLVAVAVGYLMTGRPLSAIGGVPWLVAGGAWLAYLLATQTNRHKPWVLELQREHAQAGNRFEEDPASAARFGIYTAAIWVVAFVAFLVLGFTVGWAWSLLALVGGFVVMMILLARMLFGQQSKN